MQMGFAALAPPFQGEGYILQKYCTKENLPTSKLSDIVY